MLITKKIIVIAVALFTIVKVSAQIDSLMFNQTLIECRPKNILNAYTQSKYSLLILNTTDSTYRFAYMKKGYIALILDFEGRYSTKKNVVFLKDFYWMTSEKEGHYSLRKIYYRDGCFYNKMFLGIPFSKKAFAIPIQPSSTLQQTK